MKFLIRDVCYYYLFIFFVVVVRVCFVRSVSKRNFFRAIYIFRYCYAVARIFFLIHTAIRKLINLLKR